MQQFTESLLADEHAVEKLRAAIKTDESQIVMLLGKRLTGVRFYHKRDRYKVQDTNVGALDLVEFRIIAVGHEECTLTFEAKVKVEAYLSWASRDGLDGEYYEQSDWVSDCVEMSGTAKIRLSPNAGGIADIPFIGFDAAELPIAAAPVCHQ